jgi:phosphatidate cytidylyltransferase
MTRNTIQRLLMFFLGVPLFIATVLFASFARSAVLVLFVAIIQFVGVREASALFGAKGIHLNRAYLTVLSILASLIVYLAPLLSQILPSRPSSLEILLAAGIGGSLAVLVPFAFARRETFDGLLHAIAASLFLFFYCGVLGSFLVYITSCFGQLAAPVFTFTLMSFGNDSMAWLSGVTLGKRRGLVAVSPGKSLAGFIGGFLGSIAAGVISYALFRGSSFGSLPALLAMSAVMGFAVISGDLFESAMKRSAGVKDSSSIVPGRGGVLDSFDSLLFSAPVFVLISLFMGFFPPSM